jgi:predicted nucleotidyltransferase
VKKDQKFFLDKIKKIIIEKNPSAKIYLYGSRARGTMKEESDWDLLILLNKPTITLEDERQITYPLYDLEFEEGEVISPIIYSEAEWTTKHKITPFYASVMREGKLL